LKYPHGRGVGSEFFFLRGNKFIIFLILSCFLYPIPCLYKLTNYFGTQLKCPFLSKCPYSLFS
jgi:hypothetical protein